MSYARKRALNGMFIITAAGGFGAIAASSEMAFDYAFFVPTGLVVLYAFLVGRLLDGCNEPNVADHHIDSIYFLGFLFTLVSLIVLFYELQGTVRRIDGPQHVEHAFFYLGIAVSTSIAGVLFRNITRGAYLKNHNDNQDALERNYELLKSLTDAYVTDYRETFSAIQTFLSERRETSELIAGKEREYLESLNRFVAATGTFSSSLASAESELTGRLKAFTGTAREHEAQLQGFNRLSGEIASAAERIHQEASALPLTELNEELRSFRTGVHELNSVLDSLITVLDHKVGAIR